MGSLSATVTSCIGGKNEKFAVQVCKLTPARKYFVYKTMSEFIALWGSLEALAPDVQQCICRQDHIMEVESQMDTGSLVAEWIARFVDTYAFRQTIRDLRAQEKETVSTLNTLLQLLVARISALPMECDVLAGSVGRQLVTLVVNFLQPPVAAILDLESVDEVTPLFNLDDGRKRSFEEMRPEDGEMQQRRGLFPARSGSERLAKTQKICGTREWVSPPAGKLGMGASRRRVFAEVDF